VSGMRWCTVTVTDAEGRRHSMDLQAASLFDAAHLYVVQAKKERAVGLPKPTLATVFEVGGRRKGVSRLRSRPSALDCAEPELAQWTEGAVVPAEAGAGIGSHASERPEL
jgi:hypothetical protein